MTTSPKDSSFAAAAGVREPDRAAGIEEAVALFHFVRQFRYLSDGVRDPQKVYERRAGSCSGKHILLRNLLRGVGHDAEVETIEGDFSKRIPCLASFPAELKAMIREGAVPDFHHYVRLHWQGRALALDATWPDSLQPFGFPANLSWNGQGDTELAVEPARHLGAVEDVVALKQACIASLSDAQRARRGRFLELLGEWMKGVADQ